MLLNIYWLANENEKAFAILKNSNKDKTHIYKYKLSLTFYYRKIN